MEKEICNPLGCFITNKNVLLSINKQHRADLDAILKETHQIVEEVSIRLMFFLSLHLFPIRSIINNSIEQSSRFTRDFLAHSLSTTS